MQLWNKDSQRRPRIIVINFSNNLQAQIKRYSSSHNLSFCRTRLTTLPEATAFTLGKEPFVLGKGFAECSTRQSPLYKNLLGKGSLPSTFYRGTRQNKKQVCRVPGVALRKIFSAVAPRPLTVILPSARPSTRQKKIIF